MLYVGFVPLQPLAHFSSMVNCPGVSSLEAGYNLLPYCVMFIRAPPYVQHFMLLDTMCINITQPGRTSLHQTPWLAYLPYSNL